MSCLARSLHLIVGAALIKKKGEVAFKRSIDQAESDAEVEDALGELRCEEVDVFVEESLVCRGNLDHVRGVVQKFRSWLSSFIGRQRRQVDSNFSKRPKARLEIVVDTPTRWNSTLRMLVQVVEIRGALDGVFGYIHEREGIKELGDVKKTLAHPTTERWFTIQCLVDLLTNFSAASEALSGYAYPVLVLAFLVLRTIKFRLQDETVFDGAAASVGGERFVDRTLLLMHSVRRSFISLFTERFKGVQEELLWIAYLDPRFTSTDHLTPAERSRASQCLHDAAFQIATDAVAHADTDAVSPLDDPHQELTPKKAKQNFFSTLFGSRMRKIDSESPSDGDENVKQRCKSEIVLYLSDATSVNHRAKPLRWWQENHSRFPILAQLAHK